MFCGLEKSVYICTVKRKLNQKTITIMANKWTKKEILQNTKKWRIQNLFWVRYQKLWYVRAISKSDKTEEVEFYITSSYLHSLTKGKKLYTIVEH